MRLLGVKQGNRQTGKRHKHSEQRCSCACNRNSGGGFIAQQRNAVLVGGTGTGKTHRAIAIARSCIRSGARGRFYTSSISSTGSRPKPATGTGADLPSI
jgi:hypothetical protein